MATGQWPSLMDLASRLDPHGKIDYVSEMLSQCNDYWDDAPWVEANEVGGHKFTFRTSIPAGSWRGYNMGVPYSKSTTGQDHVGVGSLEDYSQVDRMLAEDSGDIDKFRESEDAAFLEGMSQTMTQTAFYGNTLVNPLQFMGVSGFYNTVATGTALNAANVLDGGGTGSSNTSLWLKCWGERTCYFVYPRGSKVGLAMEDKADTVPGFDAAGNRFEAYTSWFRQQAGFVPQDWRQIARIANVDVTAAGLAGSNALDIFATLAQLMYLPPALGKRQSGITRTDAPDEAVPGIRPCIYTNRTFRHWADVQMIRNRQTWLRVDDYAGRPCDGYRDIPWKIVDQIVTTEARVV